MSTGHSRGPSPAPSLDEETREGVGIKIKIPATVPKPFNFAMDQRLRLRQEYNEDLKKRQRAAEERERISQLQKDREKAEELKKYRKSLTFKATPINTYNGITLNPSEKELTVPQGPRLTTLNRSRSTPSDNVSYTSADSRGSSACGDYPYSAYSYNGPTLL